MLDEFSSLDELLVLSSSLELDELSCSLDELSSLELLELSSVLDDGTSLEELSFSLSLDSSFSFLQAI